jgi:hypothetical protein
MKYLACLLAAVTWCAPAAAQTFTRNASNAAVASSYVAAQSFVSGINVVSGASAGYVLIYDAVSAPADGVVTPARCLPLAANTGIEINWRAAPIWFRNGVIVVFSTTGCFTQTSSATAFIAVDAR